MKSAVLVCAFLLYPFVLLSMDPAPDVVLESFRINQDDSDNIETATYSFIYQSQKMEITRGDLDIEYIGDQLRLLHVDSISARFVDLGDISSQSIGTTIESIKGFRQASFVKPIAGHCYVFSKTRFGRTLLVAFRVKSVDTDHIVLSETQILERAQRNLER